LRFAASSLRLSDRALDEMDWLSETYGVRRMFADSREARSLKALQAAFRFGEMAGTGPM
jgi:hypothetical protein